MVDLDALGIKTGQTVTYDLFRAAENAGLPPDAMAELWPRRTLNKDAMTAIETALAEVTETEQEETKE